MLERTPRSLLCLHSFCSECLDQLRRNNVIECPTCREVTQLKSGEVTELKVNFILGKMKEREQVQAVSTKDMKTSVQICQICEKTEALYSCDGCCKYLCLVCREQHDDMQVFTGHTISDIDTREDQQICEYHGEDITHLCRQCISPLCIKCMFIDHTHHKNHFMKFTDGIGAINCDLQEKVKLYISELDKTFETTKEKYELVKELKTELENRKAFHVKKVREASKVLKQLEDHDEMFQVIEEQYCNKLYQHTRIVRSINQVNDCLINKSKSSKIFLHNYQNLNKTVNGFLLGVNVKEVKYCIPFTLASPLSSNLVNQTVQENRDIKHLEVSKIQLDINSSAEICCRSQIAFIGNDVLLPSYNKPYRVMRLNKEGQVVARYYPKLPKRFMELQSMKKIFTLYRKWQYLLYHMD